MGQADGYFTQCGELILVKNLAKVPGVTDSPVLGAVFVIEQRSRNRDGDLFSRCRHETGLKTLDNAWRKLIGIAHGLGHAPGFIDARIESAHELTQGLLWVVSQDLRSAVVVVDHAPLTVRRYHDVR